jgi:hypothetical protein
MSTSNLRTEEQIHAQYLAKGIDLKNTKALSKVPTVTSVSPNTGYTTGSTAIVITGTNFTGVTAVKIGNTNASGFTVISPTQIRAYTAAHTAGVVSVNVTTGFGTNPNNTLFTYTVPVSPSGNVSARVGPTIYIQNQTSVLSDAQVQSAIAALQIQLDRDWQPVWGTTATLMFASRNQTVPTTAWLISMLDNSDYYGALGYHDETSSGRPYGRVFAKDDITYGYSWTVTLSHELLEMMLDPYINLTVFAQDSATSGLIYAYEVCDACEDDSLGYTINGVKVSDFVYPAWFDIMITDYTGVKFDHMSRLTAPFQLYTGGYIGVFPVPNDNIGWSSINAEKIIGPAEADDRISAAKRDRRTR